MAYESDSDLKSNKVPVTLQLDYEIPPLELEFTFKAPRNEAHGAWCDDCKKEGLVIMPVRQSYILEGKNEKKIIKRNRGLRSGYLYVFDNFEQVLKYYRISNEGYISYVGEAGFNRSQSPKDFNEKSCFKNNMHQGYASIIQFERPDKIKDIWLGYSPIIINNEVATKISNDVALREKVMTRIMLNSYNENHMVLTEAAIENKLPVEFYGVFNPLTNERYQPEKCNYINSLISAANELTTSMMYSAVMVVLKDPIGVLVDLNEFMIQAQLAYRPTENEVYRHAVATLINTLKDNIDEKARADAQRYIDRINEKSSISYPMSRWEGDGLSEAEQQLENEKRKEGASRYLQRQRQFAWSDYSKLVRESEMKKWLSSFESVTRQRQKKLSSILNTLATTYKEVYESENLKSIMNYWFDKEDDISRVYYTLTVQQFLGSTATIPMLAEFYNLHLSSKAASDKDNYLARALTFNQDQVVNHIDKLSPITVGFTPTEIATNSWSGLLYTGSAAIFGKYDAIANQVGATVSLAEQLAVPFMKDYRSGNTLSGLMISKKEYLFGYHHEKALIIVKGQGSYADARKALINGVMHIAESGQLPTRIRESVDQALKTSGDAARLNKPVSQNFIYYIEKNQLKAGMNVYQNSNKAYADKGSLTKAIESSIYTAPKLYDESHKDYKRFEDITNRKIDQAVRTNYFGAMLQTVACVFLVNAFFQAKTQDGRAVEGTKAVAGLMMLLAGSLEQRGNASKLMASELRLQQGAGVAVLSKEVIAAQTSSKLLSNSARLLSIGGAAIFAGFDVKESYDAGKNNDYITSIAYGGSAITGLTSTYLLGFTAFTGVGVAVLVAFIGINLFIGYWKKTGMENWLKHGIWGVDNNNWSLEHTLSQFDRAVVGEDIDLQDN